MEIFKGEQFNIPFEINVGQNAATPENVDGMRIKVGERLRQWPDGDLEYDNENGVWNYFLTEDQSLTLRTGELPAQIAVKIEKNILKTQVFYLYVQDSTIKERWPDNG